MKVLLGVIIGAALVIGTIFVTVNYIDKGNCKCTTDQVEQKQTDPDIYLNDDEEKVTKLSNNEFVVEGNGYRKKITIH